MKGIQVWEALKPLLYTIELQKQILTTWVLYQLTAVSVLEVYKEQG